MGPRSAANFDQATARPAATIPALARLRAWLIIHHSTLLGVALTLGAFVLYERTMARTIRWGDPGEFQLSAIVLGVPHPPGYPLWVLVAHAFYRLLPYGDALWRVDFTSVVYATATVALVYRIAQQLGVRWWLAGAATALFAIAPDFWGEATEPRAYALNAVQVALTLWLLLKWRAADPARRRGWLAAIGLLIGSAFANHATTITLVPGYALFLLGTEVQTARAAHLSALATIRRRLLDYLLAGGAALLGLVPYLLPLVRFLQGGGPYYWGDPQTWGDFVRLVSGQDFRHMVFGIPWSQFGQQVGWGGQVLLDQYGWPGVIVGLIGWAVLARRQPLVFGMLASGFVFSFVFAIMYDAATNYFYFIPGHLFWALALGMAGEAAITGLARWSAGSGIRDQGSGLGEGLATPTLQSPIPNPQPPTPNSAYRGATVALAGLLLALIVAVAVVRYPARNQLENNLARDQAEIVMRELPPKSILYLGWEATPVIKYYQTVENRRTDIFLKAGNPDDWAGHIRDWLTEGWAVYVTEPPPDLAQRFRLTPVGFAYHVEFQH